jgi:DNA-binding transcriptional regulator YhcF (GntR family)
MEEKTVLIRIDFNSDEALYLQLRNQIIMGIASANLQEGESLPSVRDLANSIGINMHTVNKAYAALREEGYIKLDRRHGAVISLDVDKKQALKETKDAMDVLLAKAICKGITRKEVHELVDSIYDGYMEDK